MRYFTANGKLVNLSVLRQRLAHDQEGKPVSQSTLSRVFSGERDPSWKLARRIAKALKVSLDELDKILEKCAQDSQKVKSAPILGEKEGD